MKKYELLIKILDQIRAEAPARYLRYRPVISDIEKTNQARAKALIHLFLKVRFGLLDFEEREALLTDGANDGGVDGYYIDSANRKVYFIQSKFRTNSDGFQQKTISVGEILKMDVDRITKGESTSENGARYNDKVQNLIRQIAQIGDPARWDFIVIILANVKPLEDSKLKRLVGGFPVEIFDHEKSYGELVFPIVSGTHFNASDLCITINLPTEFQAARIQYPVEADDIECSISVVFVPTIEIAKTLLKYKNSILKYNPRSFLGMSDSPVNTEIANTVRLKKKNEFALYNNGITMLSDDTEYTERTGKPRIGQIGLKDPQIINGGQTAWTLSRIYDEEVQRGSDPNKIFDLKEVMLKVITISPDIDEARRLSLIEAISKATNQQSPVDEADRRSNDRVQVEMQRSIYNEFGYFYERKRGEFYDGLRRSYISRDMIISRELLARLALAISGRPSSARGSIKPFFTPPRYDTLFPTSNAYKDLFFAYMCLAQLDKIASRLSTDVNDPQGQLRYGNALRLGNYAVVYVAHAKLSDPIDASNVTRLADERTTAALAKWTKFEDWAKAQKGNDRYFYEVTDPISGETNLVLDFTNYYKGATLKSDLDEFFALSNESADR